MKQNFVLLFLLVFNVSVFASVNSTNDNEKRVVIANTHRPRPHLCEPVVWYNMTSSSITVDFGIQPVNNYTVTISSLYADVDYYATSSFTTIPLAVDGFSDYSIVIETVDGDVFEGTLAASQYATSETM